MASQPDVDPRAGQRRLPSRAEPAEAVPLAAEATPEEAWSWLQTLVGDVRDRMENHRIGAESARIAYYVFLSLFPFLLSLFAATGLLGREAAFVWIMNELEAALPPAAAASLEDSVRSVTDVPRPATLSLALLLTLYSASYAVSALADGLNAAYRVRRRRRWWQKRLVALAVILTGGLAVLLGALIVVAGPELGRWLAFESFGSIMRWPVVSALVVGMTWLTYYLLPNRDQSRSKRHLLAGATVAALLWAVGTSLFRLYLAGYGQLDVVYGLLGGVVALLVWIYLAAFSVLVGGEVAATLERQVRHRRRRRRAQPPAVERA